MILASGLRLPLASAAAVVITVTLGSGVAQAGEDKGEVVAVQAALPHESAGSSLPPEPIAQSVSLPAPPQRAAPAGMDGDRRLMMLMLLGRATGGAFGRLGQ